MNPKLTAYLKAHHIGFIALSAVILISYVLNQEITHKPYTQIQQKVLKEVIEPPRAQ